MLVPPHLLKVQLLALLGVVIGSPIPLVATEVEIRFDDGYMVGQSLEDQAGASWTSWTTKFPPPIVEMDSNGRVGAFSPGSECRAVMDLPTIRPTNGPLRIEFACPLKGSGSYTATVTQVGLGDSETGGQPILVITVSAAAVYLGEGIGLESGVTQAAYLNGKAYKPGGGAEYVVRCDVDFDDRSATLAVSNDGGKTFEDLSADPEGGKFVLPQAALFDRLYLRLGEASTTGIYSIQLSQ